MECITVYKDTINPHLCSVRAMLRICDRAKRLNIPETTPIAVYSKVSKHRKKAIVSFLTRELITKNLRLAATTKHGVTKKEHLQRFSPHSVRVGACILLNTVGKNSDFIKKRLRWRSDTYQDYLR